MTDSRSVYEEALSERGFGRAIRAHDDTEDCESFLCTSNEQFAALHEGSAPYYRYVIAENIAIACTIAFDEKRRPWMAEGRQDLSGIGFVFFNHDSGCVENKKHLN